MALVAKVPRQRTALVLLHAVRQLIIEDVWRRGFALLGDSLSLLVQRRVSKETHPGIRVSLRSTPLPPVLLRGPAYKGHPWPCKPLAASMRLVPLRNTYARPPDGESARMKVSRFRPLGVVGMPRRRAGATRAADQRGFHPPYSIVPTLRVACSHRRSASAGRRASREGLPRGAWEPSTNSNATVALPTMHQRCGPGPGPVRRLSGIIA